MNPNALIDCLDALIAADTKDGGLQLAQTTFLPAIRAALAAPAPQPEPTSAADAAAAERYRKLRHWYEDVYALDAAGDLVVQVKAVGLPGESADRLDDAIDALPAVGDDEPVTRIPASSVLHGTGQV